MSAVFFLLWYVNVISCFRAVVCYKEWQFTACCIKGDGSHTKYQYYIP